MTELKQTRSSFRFEGYVSKMATEWTFKEEVATSDRRKGEKYRSLRFSVNTSENNEMPVSIFSYEPTEIFLWNSELAKAAKEKGEKFKGLRVPYADWVKKYEEYREEGYAVLQTRVGLTHDENGKLETKGLPSYIAAKVIYDNLNNGDFVAVEGTIRDSSYENQEGKMVKRKDYTIERIFKIDEIDFKAEDFKEVSYFEQDIVFVDAEMDKKEKKAFVTGRVIDFSLNWNDVDFVVDYSDGEDGVDREMEKLAEAITKKMKFGDTMQVFGDALNKVIIEEEKDEVSDMMQSFGGKKKPAHAQRFTAKTYVRELQIHGVEDYEKKVYKEEDFVKDELLQKGDDSTSIFGGKKKNPFAPIGGGGSIDISDDSLPF